MTVRSISFTGPMIAALLDGRKTQTRRVLKPQPTGQWGAMFCKDGDWYTGDALTGARIQTLKVPYAVGDLLYVRECWRASHFIDHCPPRTMNKLEAVRFEADATVARGFQGFKAGRLRGAMHMPRWASRLTLKVTDVRVERVQYITEADAKAEGARPDRSGGGMVGMYSPLGVDPFAYSRGFRRLWDSINTDRGFSWDANPWVVAISFSVIRQNVDEYLKGAAA